MFVVTGELSVHSVSRGVRNDTGTSALSYVCVRACVCVCTRALYVGSGTF